MLLALEPILTKFISQKNEYQNFVKMTNFGTKSQAFISRLPLLQMREGKATVRPGTGEVPPGTEIESDKSCQ